LGQTVSVVVVNYNRAEALRRCLCSLVGQTRPPDEIVVVDNGSDDGSAGMVENDFSDHVILVRMKENTGFARGNNEGIKASIGQWIALINNDAVADPRWLERMLETARQNPAASLVASRILCMDDRELMDNAGVAVWPDGMSRGVRRLEKDDKEVNQKPFIPSGCAMMIKREAFQQAEGFDESFFAYSEDTDLGIKVRLMGYGCAGAPNAFVYHETEGGTLGAMSPKKLFLVERNRVSIMLRYFPLTAVLSSPAYTALRCLGLAAALVKELSSRQRRKQDKERSRAYMAAGLFPAVILAWLAAVARAPRDLKVRAQWKKRAAVHPSSMAAWLCVYRLDWKSLTALGV